MFDEDGNNKYKFINNINSKAQYENKTKINIKTHKHKIVKLQGRVGFFNFSTILPWASKTSKVKVYEKMLIDDEHFHLQVLFQKIFFSDMLVCFQ